MAFYWHLPHWMSRYYSLCHVVESNVTQETLSSWLTIHFIHLSESQKKNKNNFVQFSMFSVHSAKDRIVDVFMHWRTCFYYLIIFGFVFIYLFIYFVGYSGWEKRQNIKTIIYTPNILWNVKKWLVIEILNQAIYINQQQKYTFQISMYFFYFL